jgi:hypothetical protein
MIIQLLLGTVSKVANPHFILNLSIASYRKLFNKENETRSINFVVSKLAKKSLWRLHCKIFGANIRTSIILD